MRPDALEDALQQCEEQRKLVVAIVGIAGATETGAVDDLRTVGRIAARRRIHFHADAAWGGPFLLSNTHRGKLAGIEHADTVSICGHKQFQLPQGMSVLLCRDPLALQTLRTPARYQAREGSFDLGSMSPEGSRGPHCLHLFAALALLGRRGYEALIDASIDRARAFAGRVHTDAAFELMEPPQTNIVIYRYIPSRLRGAGPEHIDHALPAINRLNERLQSEQFERGESLISRTTIHHGRHADRPAVVLRAVFSNPNTDGHAMQAVLDEQRAIGESLEAMT